MVHQTLALLCLLLGALHFTSAQSTASATAQATATSGGGFQFSADLAARAAGDTQGVTGTARVGFVGDILNFDFALVNGVNIIATDLHLSPQKGNIVGGPLIVRLFNASANPLSSNKFPGNKILQTGTVGNAQLLANPMLAQARAGLAALGINDNKLATISDVQRLLAAGVVYGDVHSVQKPPPLVEVRGLYQPIAATSGRKLKQFTSM